MQEDKDKLYALVDSLNEESKLELIGYLSKKILIPGYFTRARLEAIVQYPISAELFEEFRDRVKSVLTQSEILDDQLQIIWRDFIVTKLYA